MSGTPLAPPVIAALPERLAAQANARVWLACLRDGTAVGVAVCFIGFSTFAAQPLLNVHDLAVLPAHRGRGIGRRLLETAETAARALGCCKMTLEVRDDNVTAQGLYAALGYAGAWRFWSKQF